MTLGIDHAIEWQPDLHGYECLDLRAGYAAFAVALTASFARIDADDLIAISSELTLVEVLVKPFADGNVTLQQRCTKTLQARHSLRIVPVTRAILIAAACLRAQYPALKMPDALHATTALVSGAGYLVSNDARFHIVAGLEQIKVES